MTPEQELAIHQRIRECEVARGRTLARAVGLEKRAARAAVASNERQKTAARAMLLRGVAGALTDEISELSRRLKDGKPADQALTVAGSLIDAGRRR